MTVKDPLRVVVVDDDFMIARLHGKFVETLPGYQLAAVAYNSKQTLSIVEEIKPDLLLLDVYMPDCSGLELLRLLRAQKHPCDVILITAAKELEVVEEGFRLGVFDYLIKPFDLERFRKTFDKYLQFKNRLSRSNNDTVDQMVVDDLKNYRSISSQNNGTGKSQRKGIDQRTLERIQQHLKREEAFSSVEEVAEAVGVSRSTARTYLLYLVEQQIAEEQLLYGTVGRPQRLYRYK